MKVVALTGGVGGGKFLRGLVRAVAPRDVTAVVNTGDDLWMHGLRICPDLDSVSYWLAGEHDRERGWGRREETFRATQELRRFDPEAAWFGLGDLDLAMHLYRTRLLRDGLPLSDVTARVAARFGIAARILPCRTIRSRLGSTWSASVESSISISRSTGCAAAGS